MALDEPDEAPEHQDVCVYPDQGDSPRRVVVVSRNDVEETWDGFDTIVLACGGEAEGRDVEPDSEPR